MIVYRISSTTFSQDISGTGAKLYGARWNSKGNPMLYAGSSISLSLLEMLVHAQFRDFSIALDLVYIQVPETISIREISLSKLKKNWHTDEAYTRFIGDEFIKSQKSALLKVPSAVVQEEFNFLINPLHEEFKKIKIHKTKSFRPDKRLFSI